MQKHTAALLFAAVLTAGSLAGCTVNETGTAMVTDSAFWQNMQQKLMRIDSVSESGRFTYKGRGDRISALFFYEGKTDGTYTLKIMSPIGNEIASLVQKKDEAELVSYGRTIKDKDAASLFKQIIDTELPLHIFNDIMLGIAGETSEFTHQGILHKSYTEGFTVQYKDYKTYGDIALPAEFQITSATDSLEIKVREVRDIRFK